MRCTGLQNRIAQHIFRVFAVLILISLASLYIVMNTQVYKTLTGYVFTTKTTLETLSTDIVRTTPSKAMGKMEIVERRMEARQKLLVQKCSELGLDKPGTDYLHKANAWEFLINQEYHLIWCNVFKAASSSWMYNFNLLTGYSPEFLQHSRQVPLVLARSKYPRVTEEELRKAQNNSLSFLIVRHPFERILSAYRDKFMFAYPYSYHDKLGKKIIKAFRKDKAKIHSPKYPTFSEVVEWLLLQIQRFTSIDMHFMPVTTFCTPCQVKFDLILKFETLDEDQLYLIEKAGLNGTIQPERRNGAKGMNTLKLLQKFYSQLTRKQLYALYRYYRNDFEIFGYNVTPYYDMIRADENDDAVVSKSTHSRANLF